MLHLVYLISTKSRFIIILLMVRSLVFFSCFTTGLCLFVFLVILFLVYVLALGHFLQVSVSLFFTPDFCLLVLVLLLHADLHWPCYSYDLLGMEVSDHLPFTRMFSGQGHNFLHQFSGGQIRFAGNNGQCKVHSLLLTMIKLCLIWKKGLLSLKRMFPEEYA